MGLYLVREEPLELCRGSAAQAAGPGVGGGGWEATGGWGGGRWNAQMSAWVGDSSTRAEAGAGVRRERQHGFLVDWMWAPEERGVKSEFVIFNLSDLNVGLSEPATGRKARLRGVRLVRGLWVQMCCVEMPIRCPRGGACK